MSRPPVTCEPTPTGRRETADRIAAETGGAIIHPYDNYNVMAGQVSWAWWTIERWHFLS